MYQIGSLFNDMSSEKSFAFRFAESCMLCCAKLCFWGVIAKERQRRRDLPPWQCPYCMHLYPLRVLVASHMDACCQTHGMGVVGVSTLTDPIQEEVDVRKQVVPEQRQENNIRQEWAHKEQKPVQEDRHLDTNDLVGKTVIQQIKEPDINNKTGIKRPVAVEQNMLDNGKRQSVAKTYQKVGIGVLPKTSVRHNQLGSAELFSPPGGIRTLSTDSKPILPKKGAVSSPPAMSKCNMGNESISVPIKLGSTNDAVPMKTTADVRKRVELEQRQKNNIWERRRDGEEKMLEGGKRRENVERRQELEHKELKPVQHLVEGNEYRQLTTNDLMSDTKNQGRKSAVPEQMPDIYNTGIKRQVAVEQHMSDSGNGQTHAKLFQKVGIGVLPETSVRHNQLGSAELFTPPGSIRSQRRDSIPILPKSVMINSPPGMSRDNMRKESISGPPGIVTIRRDSAPDLPSSTNLQHLLENIEERSVPTIDFKVQQDEELKQKARNELELKTHISYILVSDINHVIEDHVSAKRMCVPQNWSNEKFNGHVISYLYRRPECAPVIIPKPQEYGAEKCPPLSPTMPLPPAVSTNKGIDGIKVKRNMSALPKPKGVRVRYDMKSRKKGLSPIFVDHDTVKPIGRKHKVVLMDIPPGLAKSSRSSSEITVLLVDTKKNLKDWTPVLSPIDIEAAKLGPKESLIVEVPAEEEPCFGKTTIISELTLEQTFQKQREKEKKRCEQQIKTGKGLSPVIGKSILGLGVQAPLLSEYYSPESERSVSEITISPGGEPSLLRHYSRLNLSSDYHHHPDSLNRLSHKDRFYSRSMFNKVGRPSMQRVQELIGDDYQKGLSTIGIQHDSMDDARRVSVTNKEEFPIQPRSKENHLADIKRRLSVISSVTSTSSLRKDGSPASLYPVQTFSVLTSTKTWSSQTSIPSLSSTKICRESELFSFSSETNSVA